MTPDLAGQLDALPHIGEQVNTRTRREVGLRDAIGDLKRAVASRTAGASPAVTERPAAWLDHVRSSVFPSGGEWAVKSLLVDVSQSLHERGLEPGWGFVRLVGDTGYAGDIKLVTPTSTYVIDVNALSGELARTHYEHGDADLWSAQLLGGKSLLPLNVRTVNLSPLETLARARTAVRDARDDALTDLRQRLDDAMAAFAQQAPREVVNYLTDQAGIGQLLTAKAIGVSPTAVRKWKRGEPARPEHRSRLSLFAALANLLTELGPYDPAGWLDMPISIESTLTPIDLFLAGRSDLVLLRAANQASPQETLDAFDDRWREIHGPDPDYEVVTLRDGSRAALPRRRTES